MYIQPIFTRTPFRPLPPLAPVLALAFVLHWLVWPLFTSDMTAFLIPWLDHIRATGPIAAFAQPFSNYTPPYLYLLAAASPLVPAIGKLATIKLVSVAGTAALAGALYRLFRQMRVRQPERAAALIFLLPTATLNAAMMGQCDALYVAACVMALTAVVGRRHAAMFVWCGVAFAFKAQAALIAPFFLAIAIRRRIDWRLWLAAPAATMAMMLPALAIGWPAGDLATVYLRQAGTYADLSRNAPNIWMIAQSLPHVSGGSLLALAWVSAIGATIAFTARIAMVGLDDRTLVRMAALAPMLAAGLLPHMHERYFFLADVLTLAYWAICRDRDSLALMLLVQAGSLLATLGYFGLGSWPAMFGAVAMIAATWLTARPLLSAGANDNRPPWGVDEGLFDPFPAAAKRRESAPENPSLTRFSVESVGAPQRRL